MVIFRACVRPITYLFAPKKQFVYTSLFIIIMCHVIGIFMFYVCLSPSLIIHIIYMLHVYMKCGTEKKIDALSFGDHEIRDCTCKKIVITN